MHYVFPTRAAEEERSGSRGRTKLRPRGTEERSSDTDRNSEEEEEMQPLEHKKRTLSVFPQLPEKAMLTGKDVNKILSIAFITEPVAKKLRTGISPSTVLNPQPISSTIPHTRSVARATHIIHIQDDPEPDTTPSTIITEKPPSPPQPQSPPPETDIPPQTSDPEPMQLDPPEIPKKRPETLWSKPEIPEQRLQLTGPNPEA
jgi:hypothetical protein